MATRDSALLRQMDDYTLDGKYHEATDVDCRLVAAHPDRAAHITTHVMTTAAPYLHVSAHPPLLPSGEFRNVNYDHTILGIRAGLRLQPWLSERDRNLEDQDPLVQGSVDERFQRMLAAIVDGDNVLSYRLFLGLAGEPELRARLRNEVLFAAIIDQQEFNSFRRVRHIGQVL